jgi:hypothetical protein
MESETKRVTAEPRAEQKKIRSRVKKTLKTRSNFYAKFISIKYPMAVTRPVTDIPRRNDYPFRRLLLGLSTLKKKNCNIQFQFVDYEA